MATPKTMIEPQELESLAWQYVNECLENTKLQHTASGKLVNIKDRHIPTISYFLKIWIPLKGSPTISRATFYNWVNNDNNPDKLDTIKRIEGLFEALAIDIVANEGKGIFYSKNKLNFADKVEQKNNERFTPIELVVKYSDNIKPM
jgi:hypothetical protein